MANYAVRISDEFDELQARLGEYPRVLREKVLRGGLRSGGVVFRNAARQNLRAVGAVKTGNLLRSLRVSTNGYRPEKPEVNIKAGRRVTKKQRARGARDVFYAHIVERGARKHWIRVSEDAAAGRSIRSLNARVNRGSLVIGKSFVGQAVAHPGLRGRFYMRTARDTKRQEAVAAFQRYVATKSKAFIERGTRPDGGA